MWGNIFLKSIVVISIFSKSTLGIAQYEPNSFQIGIGFTPLKYSSQEKSSVPTDKRLVHGAVSLDILSMEVFISDKPKFFYVPKFTTSIGFKNFEEVKTKIKDKLKNIQDHTVFENLDILDADVFVEKMDPTFIDSEMFDNIIEEYFTHNSYSPANGRGQHVDHATLDSEIYKTKRKTASQFALVTTFHIDKHGNKYFRGGVSRGFRQKEKFKNLPSGNSKRSGRQLQVQLHYSRPLQFTNSKIDQDFPVLRFEIKGYQGYKRLEVLDKELYYFTELPISKQLLKKSGNQLFFQMPMNNTYFDLTQHQAFIPDSWMDEIESLENDHNINILSFDTQDLEQKISTWFTENLDEKTTQNLQTALKLINFANTSASYLYESSEFYQTLRSVMAGSSKSRLIAQRMLLIGNVLYLLSTPFTDPTTYEYLETGKLSPRSSINRVLSYSNLELHPDFFEEFIDKKQISYPQLLDILQDALNDPNIPENGKKKAMRSIEQHPTLKYLNALEQYTIQTIQGIDKINNGNAHDLAETLFLYSKNNKDQQEHILKYLNTHFGLSRQELKKANQESKVKWFINPAKVAMAKDNPNIAIKTPTQASDKLNVFQSNDDYLRTLKIRKVGVIKNMLTPLGLTLDKLPKRYTP